MLRHVQLVLLRTGMESVRTIAVWEPCNRLYGYVAVDCLLTNAFLQFSVNKINGL